MNKNKVKKMLSKIIVTSLIMTIVFSGVFSSLQITAKADSNTRLAAVMDLARNKNVSDMEGIDELTYDDLRMIGVYLSNFYVPFSTALGTSTEEDVVKKQMADALKSNCNMTDELSKYLVEYVFKESLNSAKELSIGALQQDGSVSTKYTDGYGQSLDLKHSMSDFAKLESNEDGSMVASYYNFMNIFSGRISGDTKEDTTQAWSGLWQPCLFWSDGTSKKVVLDTQPSTPLINVATGELTGSFGKNFSASSLAYAMVNDSLNYKQGIGSSIFSVSDKSAYENIMTNIKIKEKVSVTGSRMYIDCFGNILGDFGTNTYVILPACVNPYSWYVGDASTAGKNLNLINTFFMGEADNNNIKYDGAKYTYSVFANSYSLFNKANWTIFKGSDTELDKDPTDKDIKQYLKDAGQGTYSTGFLWSKTKSAFPEWNTYNFAIESKFSTGGSYKEVKNKDFPTLQDMCMIDTLQVYNTGGAVKKINLFQKKNGSSIYETVLSGIGNDFSAINTDNKLTVVSSAKANYTLSIFLSYAYAYYDTATGTDRKVSWSYNKNGFPTMSGDKLDWSSLNISSSYQDEQLKSLAYYFLHPLKGGDVVKVWFKYKASAILLGIHESIVGNTSTNSSTGGTRYVGFSGYVTVPELTDIAWTNWLMQQYNIYLIYLVVLVSMFILASVVIGNLSYQQGLVGVILFTVLSAVPPYAINTAVNITNEVSNKIYSSKFTYWAIVQQYQYLGNLKTALSAGSSDKYLTELFQNQQESSDGMVEGNSAVTLKWMCPKKENYLANIVQDVKSVSQSKLVSKWVSNAAATKISGETFKNSANSLYLYRNYVDIGMYSSKTYIANYIMGSTVNSLNGIKTSNDKSLDHIVNEVYTQSSTTNDSLAQSISRGFNYDTLSSSGSWTSSTNKRFYLPLTSVTVKDAIVKANSETTVDLTSGNIGGIKQESFDTTLGNIINSTVDQESIGLFSYGLYTESPYYYFSFNLQDQLSSQSASAVSVLSTSNIYKDLFLQGSGGYFYNNTDSAEGVSGFGEMRDFMDMRSLFTCVIPYLKRANDVVVNWDDKYGLYLYDDVNLSYEGSVLQYPQDVINAGKDSELYYKYWHNANVAQLFNMYTPWVDIMYDCKYANPVSISVAGRKYLISDPLNPASYPGEAEGRPMIFSKSEQAYWGIKDSDLTGVEQRILSVAQNSYKALLPLMNYYTFPEEVLNTSSAMLETFEFNKAFSQNGVFSSTYTLHPQNYELKNFSYDAFLRLIISSTTNEELQPKNSTEGLYERVMKNSSLFTGLTIIGLDALSVWVIPLLKFLFIIGVALVIILVLLLAVFRLEENLASVFMKSLVLPLGKFCSTSILMAFLVSLFMSNGNEAITGSNSTTISLGDPVLVILLMIIINCAVVYFYITILMGIKNDIVSYTKAVGSTAAGAVGGVFSKMAGSLGSGLLSGTIAGSMLSNAIKSSNNKSNSARRDRKGRNTTSGSNTQRKSTIKRVTKGSDEQKQEYAYDKYIKNGESIVKSHRDDAKARGFFGRKVSNAKATGESMKLKVSGLSPRVRKLKKEKRTSIMSENKAKRSKLRG